jgi:acetylglutamate kinase
MLKARLSDDLSHPSPLVVKIGGSILGSHDTTLEDIVSLQRLEKPMVIIHGGGQIISDWMKKQGVMPSFVNGLRVTDSASMEIVLAVLSGLINKQLVSTINSMGGKALGMSGADGMMLTATVLDPSLGLVGKVTNVDTAPIHIALENGYVPVIAPVAVNEKGVVGEDLLLNINGDTAAGEIAFALRAEGIVFLTDVEGVLGKESEILKNLTQDEAIALMGTDVIAGGMVPKIQACLTALGSVKSSRIIDGRDSSALLDLVNGKNLGTKIE